jgi:adenosylhomocysteine nucleosidase
MIAITFALPAESASITALLREKRQAPSTGGTITYGKIESKPVAIFHTGVGRKNCKARIDNFLRAVQPKLLISSGFAGGAVEDLDVGDLILGKNFSHPGLIASAQQILADHDPRVVKLFTSTSIVHSIVERNKIAQGHGAAAVDMETEIIARACAACGVPLLSLRVISDSLSEPFPVPPFVLFDIERQRTNYVKLLTHLFTHPAAISSLVRFARQTARAREALTNAIVDLAPAL